MWQGCFSSTYKWLPGQLFLAQSFGALDHEGPIQFLEDMDSTFILLGLGYNFPVMHWILCRLPIPSIKHYVTGLDRLIDYGKRAYYRYLNEADRKSERKNLLTKIIDQPEDESLRPLTDFEAYSEVGKLVFAGTDTTSTTLTYLWWELAKNPQWQDKIREELKTHVGSKEETRSYRIPSYADIVDLPVLDAVINEALRLHPAAPASLPRITPPGGRTVNGYYIPEQVST